MRINTSTQRVHSREGTKESRKGKRKGSTSVNDLKRSDLIADIFNHDDEKQKKKRDARVFLSRSSSALTEELRSTVHSFLKNNHSIAKALEEIALPEEYEELVPVNADLSLRKMSMYKQWMLHYGEEGDSEERLLDEGEAQAPFREIRRQGKDGEIQQIYQEHESRKEELLRSKRKNVPNYYYLVFPETYSFN